MNFMQKKIFSFVISLTFILSCITPFRAFAAAEEVLAAFEYTSEGIDFFKLLAYNTHNEH